MNLLASETVSINDLIFIISEGKDAKELKKIKEIAKNCDSDGQGYIDKKEFGQFIREMNEYRHEIIVRCSQSVKKLLQTEWCREKESQISHVWKKICAINCIITHTTIDFGDFSKIQNADKQLSKRKDLTTESRDQADQNDNRIGLQQFFNVITALDEDYLTMRNQEEEAAGAHLKKKATQIETNEEEQEPEEKVVESADQLFEKLVQMQNDKEEQAIITSLFDEYLKRRYIEGMRNNTMIHQSQINNPNKKKWFMTEAELYESIKNDFGGGKTTEDAET